MGVPVRYIFAIIALGLMGFATSSAQAQSCGSCNPQPPPCHCNPPPPCHACQPPTVVVPPPYVPPPNIVVVNAGARAQASATAIAIANVQTGDTIIHQNTVMDAGASAGAVANATTFAVSEASRETVTSERDALLQAICLDATNNPHPASQTFGDRAVARDYSGEVFRCIAGTRMRYTLDGQQYDCAAGQALWYEGNAVQCRTQIERRNCNERSLLRRFGPGDKMVHIRSSEERVTQHETTFNGAMTMDGGVGQSVW